MNDLSDKQNLCSLIKVPACCKNLTKSTCIDLELTNLPKIFYNQRAIETGLSDFYKMTITIMQTTFCKQEPKIIPYRDYKNFLQVLLEASFNDYDSGTGNLSSFIMPA